MGHLVRSTQNPKKTNNFDLGGAQTKLVDPMEVEHY